MKTRPSDALSLDPVTEDATSKPVSSRPANDGVVLALNSGSSSLKFGVYRVRPARIERLLSGEAETTGQGMGSFHATDASKQPVSSGRSQPATLAGAMQLICQLIEACQLPALNVVGHRIVHGGPHLRHPCLITNQVMQELQRAAAFAPLHTPASLALIALATTHFPAVAQVACFDTGFHAHMPAIARTLPLPREIRDQGIQRYGFHGLSCESILHQLGECVPARLIIVHLGNGASVTAVRAGHSIDTSMGLTPTGGVIMSTRSGDLDPGVLAYLMREKKLDAAAIEQLVDHRCGLLGVSGIDGDMRRLHAAAATHADARLAIAMFCYSVRKHIVAMMAVLNGADMLVFTGGIGENDAAVRATICADLAWAGIELSDARNKTTSNPINRAGSTCAVLVLPSEEDEQIARHAVAILS